MSNVSATTNPTTPKPGFSTRQLAVIGVMTAVTCILAPFSLPIGPVPISLTNLAIYFSLYVLGTKYGCVSYLVYLLIGFIGVPVFSGFTSGPGKLLGPTGGYLIGFMPRRQTIRLEENLSIRMPATNAMGMKPIK